MIYTDFSDTPHGADLIEKIQKLKDEVEDLQDQIVFIERNKDQLEAEYDCLEEIWRDSFDCEDDE